MQRFEATFYDDIQWGGWSEGHKIKSACLLWIRYGLFCILFITPAVSSGLYSKPCDLHLTNDY